MGCIKPGVNNSGKVENGDLPLLIGYWDFSLWPRAFKSCISIG